MTEFKIKVQKQKTKISPKLDHSDEIFVMGGDETPEIASPRTLDEIVKALYDARQTSDQLADGDTFSIDGVQIAHVEGVHVLADVETLPGQKETKAAETISFECMYYGKPDTDYYLHCSIFVDGREHVPAFAKHRLVKWSADAKTGKVKVTMLKKDAEKRGLEWLDGVVSTQKRKDDEAEEQAA